eukprot:TRINITY_DN24678_c0_g1_i1.p1 TRINITY_DN24678_c0_g1~~TRINITY_DN24678_c0_g1_i1.p1  ORF type:complete len:620 (+),score=125.22 TRINITY_DN24678_c0_g1_i1:97-1956(+)
MQRGSWGASRTARLLLGSAALIGAGGILPLLHAVAGPGAGAERGGADASGPAAPLLLLPAPPRASSGAGRATGASSAAGPASGASPQPRVAEGGGEAAGGAESLAGSAADALRAPAALPSPSPGGDASGSSGVATGDAASTPRPAATGDSAEDRPALATPRPSTRNEPPRGGVAGGGKTKLDIFLEKQRQSIGLASVSMMSKRHFRGKSNTKLHPVTGKTPRRHFKAFRGPDPRCSTVLDAPLKRDAESIAECAGRGIRLHQLCIHGVPFLLANASFSEQFWFEAKEAIQLAHILQLLPQLSFGASRPVFVDVGMNLGVFSNIIAAAAPWVDVHAYEPQPACVRLARCSAAANGASGRVFVHNAYVNSGTKETPPPVPVAGCDPEYSLRHQSAMQNRQRGVGSTEVPVADVVADIRGRSLAGIKIDVEGTELGVLEQLMSTVLERLPHLVMVELSPQWWPTGELTRCVDVLDRLMSAGYVALWYNQVQWRVYEMPPHQIPFRWIGTRYVQEATPLETAQMVCSKADSRGRIDVALVRGANATADYCTECVGCGLDDEDLSLKRIFTRIIPEKIYFRYCQGAVAWEGRGCSICGRLRRTPKKGAHVVPQLWINKAAPSEQ